MLYLCSVCGRLLYTEDMAIIDDNGWHCCKGCYLPFNSADTPNTIDHWATSTGGSDD